MYECRDEQSKAEITIERHTARESYDDSGCGG